MLSQNVTGPVGPIISRIYWYLFHLHLFQKHLRTFLQEKLLTRISQMFTGPVGPVGLFSLAPSHFIFLELLLGCGQRFNVSV